MAEQETPTLGGFEALSNMIGGGIPTPEEGGATPVNEPAIVDPEVIRKQFTENEETTKETEGSADDTTDGTEGDNADTDSGSGSSIDSTPKSGEVDSGEDMGGTPPDLSEFEEDITALINEKLSEQLNWEIAGDDAPKSIEEVVDFMKEVVAEASVPSYANEDIKKLDEYVRDGGDIKNYYDSLVSGKVNVDTVDVDNEFDQKSILKEHLSNQGYNDTRINKMMKRYEDAGVLDEEASDALELLKEYNVKAERELLETQKKHADLATEQQQNFISSVQESVKELDSVRGVPISKKEKEDLMKYILVPDKEGYTQYQREYMSDIKNLLESAYFTKKGDALISAAKKQGESTAVKNLHEKLKAKKGDPGRSSGDHSKGSASSGLSLLGSMISGS